MTKVFPLSAPYQSLRVWVCLICLLFVLLSGQWGCSLTRESTDTLRSPMEQLLLSQSLERSFAETHIPFSPDTPVYLEANGYSSDTYVAKAAFQDWLSRQGYLIKSDPEEADYTVRLNVQSLGTETDLTFIGLPPISGTFIPVSLPELSFYKSVEQVGYTRIIADIFDTTDYQHITSLPMLEGQVYYTNYTLLFIISWHTTDLNPPPPT